MLAAGILWNCFTLAAPAESSRLPPASSRRIDFLADIKPLFEKQCVSCHGPEKQKSDYRLDSRAHAIKGGEIGQAILMGDSARSPLVHYVAGTHAEITMPPKGARLTDEQVGMLRAWIDQGANWPANPKDIPVADKSDWWSFKPIAEVPPPKGAAHPIDAFILARLAEKGLQPAAPADPRTLLRRVYYDLIGLSPTPEEIDAFAADTHPLAYEKRVDALLASPRFGERWARHWLDTVHYGDTHGYDKDKVRPNAWPYRDYVIRSFNTDKPYTRFVEEQIAGDVLHPDTRDGIVALGFLAAGPWDYVGHAELREGTLDKAITRNLDRDDMVTVTMNTFASVTAQCARCHNHKFDPIRQEDYYSLQAVFAAVDRADRTYETDPVIVRLKEQREALLARSIDHATRDRLRQLETDLAEISKQRSALPAPGKVYAAATDFAPQGNFTPTRGKARPVFLLHRGSEKSPREQMAPGTLALAHVPAMAARFELSRDHGEGERRAALARWLTDKRNPLTWRSIVNRVWQYHFGRGMVETPNDFGHMGALPSHPELLDHLAARFRDGDQSLKALHRLIVTSRTYRQASAHDPRNAAIDAANQYLWRMNRTRLDAETLRDGVLHLAGKLDLTMGGPGFRAFGFKDDHSPHYKYAEYNPDDPASHRRSVYRFVVRSVPDPFMETLDCADPSQIVPRRNETLTALQALALLNNPFMLRMSEHVAARVASRSTDPHQQAELLCRLAYGRAANAVERETLPQVIKQHGLPSAARLILNSNEFAFID